jgi:hypothetical protein
MWKLSKMGESERNGENGEYRNISSIIEEMKI